jgi:hypothetical protein
MHSQSAASLSVNRSAILPSMCFSTAPEPNSFSAVRFATIRASRSCGTSHHSRPSSAIADFWIYAVRHFQQNIEQQKILKGGKNADAFVIAKAGVERGTVVTMEVLKPNAAKIPNICEHFSIPCLSLEKFMEEEDWQF